MLPSPTFLYILKTAQRHSVQAEVFLLCVPGIQIAAQVFLFSSECTEIFWAFYIIGLWLEREKCFYITYPTMSNFGGFHVFTLH